MLKNINEHRTELNKLYSYNEKINKNLHLLIINNINEIKIHLFYITTFLLRQYLLIPIYLQKNLRLSDAKEKNFNEHNICIVPNQAVSQKKLFKIIIRNNP